MKAVANGIADKVRAKFDFSIDKFPLYGPESMSTPFYGLFRSDTSEVVGNAVTNRYNPHTTEDVLALVDASAEAFDGVAEVKCHFREGHYVEITPGRDHRLKVFGQNDNVFPRMMIRAGYDGKAFNATIGYFRDLCQNLSMMRLVNGTSVSIRHTSGLRHRMQILINQFQKLRDGWDSLTNFIQEAEATEVSLRDFMDSIYPLDNEASQNQVTRHRNRTEVIFKRVLDERRRSGRGAIDRTNFNVSGWEAYNAIQGYVQHAATRKGSFNNEFDRVLLASNDQAVLHAERLVQAAVAA